MINEVWTRIVEHEGEEFTQIRGQIFTYKVKGKVIFPSTINQSISIGVFEKALALLPVKNVSSFQHLWAPSYLYAILTDDRIIK